MANPLSPEDIRLNLEKQIADLRKEVTNIRKSISSRAEDLDGDLRENARDAYDAVSGQAHGAIRQMRRQALAVSEAFRENPRTAATVLSSAGVIGFVIGLILGQALSTGHPHRR
jgi:ElaB/YqjD/DUF883 family membrane-anchored ribosome-binding protein